jgi:hypothetical protein
VTKRSAVARAEGEVREDEDDDEQHDAPDAHHPRVSDVPRAFRFDAADGRDCGDDDCETKPDEPVHERVVYTIRASRPGGVGSRSS